MYCDNVPTTRPRDILIKRLDNTFKRISELHGAYDPLQYPLLFPNGEYGWHRGILKKDVVAEEIIGLEQIINEEEEEYDNDFNNNNDDDDENYYGQIADQVVDQVIAELASLASSETSSTPSQEFWQKKLDSFIKQAKQNIQQKGQQEVQQKVQEEVQQQTKIQQDETMILEDEEYEPQAENLFLLTMELYHKQVLKVIQDYLKHLKVQLLDPLQVS
jgi:hypothetical protein